MAQQYVLSDQTFMTQGSGSFTAHQDLIAGATLFNPKRTEVSSTCPPRAVGLRRSQRRKDVVPQAGRIGAKYYSNAGPYPCLSYATIRDLLDAKNVSWKYYAPPVIGGSGGDLERLRCDQGRA